MNIDKCHQGGCEHTLESLHEETHDEGLCWKVTKPELEEINSNKKYCPCTKDKELIRRYERTGYMQVEKTDHMITKKCSICEIDTLFRVNENVCMLCKTRSEYD